MSNDFFKMRGIVKQYQMGNEVQTILKGIDLDIDEGQFLSILGPSGSGWITRTRRSSPCAAAWAWCSSASTCSRT